MALQVGDVVLVGRAAKERGVVKYIGTTSFKEGDWVGIELENPVGKNDGSVGAERYFDCEANHGMFVRQGSVVKESPEVTVGEALASQQAGHRRSSCSSGEIRCAVRDFDGRPLSYDDLAEALEEARGEAAGLAELLGRARESERQLRAQLLELQAKLSAEQGQREPAGSAATTGAEQVRQWVSGPEAKLPQEVQPASPAGGSPSAREVAGDSSSGCCPNWHPLAPFTTPRPGFSCDKCGKDMAVQAQAFSCRECNWDECEECCGKTQDHLGIQGLWKARGNHRRFKIVRTTDSPSDLEINGFVITGRYQEGWWAKGTLKENGQWYQGCVREEQGERTGFVRVHLWDTNEIVTNFREKEDSPWGADSLLMRSARVKVNPKVLCIAQNSIEQICAQLRSGETASDSAAALLESRVEDSSAWRSLPVPGQQLVVLPSQGLEVAGREYYREGDAGRVSSEVYLDGNGDKAFDVTWLRTGLTWRMSKDWASRVRIVGAAPAFGEEVEALPGAEFTNGSGTEFYAPGDRGRVSSDLRLVPVQGRSELRFGVAWYQSGLVSFMTAEGWTKKFNVVGSARTLVLGDEVQALPGQKLTVDGVVYYSEGDVGRVTNVGIRKNDDLDACEISWYKSGRSSVQTVESWPKTVRLIEGEEKSNLVGVEDKRIIEEAVASQEVTMAKPMQLVSGQPKEAAKGLYHMMRVKDPFADDSAARIEQEVDSFVKDLKESAVVLALLEAKQGDADEVRRIENFYGGEEAISRAKGDIEYFGKVAGMSDGATGLQIVERVEAETAGNLRYILREKASEVYVEGPNAFRDKGRGPVDLQHFLGHRNVKAAELAVPHVVALRLYTTTAFKYLNSPLRSRDQYYNKFRSHPLPATMAFVSEGIKKLRTAYAIDVEEGSKKSQLTLWRGLKNMKISEDFLADRQGGTELAPMSTTSNLEVAAKYASSGESVLLKISLDNFMQFGADLEWLSAFPGEAEVLYPPLTYLQPTGREPQVVELKSGHKFTVYEVKPTIP